MKKEKMEKLDKVNLLWLLENLSLGNIMRGVLFLGKLVRPVKECVVSTVEKAKSETRVETAKESKASQK